MQILREFREFAVKGNVIDLAIGVIIGAAFWKIISSLVDDMIMPIIGKIFGGLDFSNIYYAFGNPAIHAGMPLSEAKKIGAVLAYGNFITVTINFLIIAFCIFLMIKAMNTAMKNVRAQEKKEAAIEPTEVALLSEIRDLLAKK